MRVALLLITAAAAGARFATLDQQSFTSDEAVTVRLLEMGFGEMLAELPDSERTPPLYYVIAWAWARIAGTGEVGLRSLSVVFATAAIPVVFHAARRLLPPAGALAAAVLVAVNPLLFWYSQEARAYALYVLLSALSLLYFARALSGSSPRAATAWALSSIAALCTHYFAIFLVLPEAAWLAWRRRIGRVVAAVVAASTLALLPLAVAQGAGSGQFAEGEQGERLLAILKQLLVGVELDTSAELLLKVAAVLAVAIAAAAWWRAAPPDRMGVTVAAGLAAAFLVPTAVLASVGFDYFNSRNVLAAVIPMSIALGGAYALRRAQPLASMGAALLSAAGVASVALTLTSTFPQREDWRALAREVGHERQALVVTPGDGEAHDAYPLEPYLDGVALLPSRGACVAEVTVGALPIRAGRKVSWSAIGRRRVRAPALPGFSLARRVVDETFVLYRYRAPAPRRVPPGRLLGLRRDTREHGGVLLVGNDRRQALTACGGD